MIFSSSDKITAGVSAEPAPMRSPTRADSIRTELPTYDAALLQPGPRDSLLPSLPILREEDSAQTSTAVSFGSEKTTDEKRPTAVPQLPLTSTSPRAPAPAVSRAPACSGLAGLMGLFERLRLHKAQKRERRAARRAARKERRAARRAMRHEHRQERRGGGCCGGRKAGKAPDVSEVHGMRVAGRVDDGNTLVRDVPRGFGWNRSWNRGPTAEQGGQNGAPMRHGWHGRCGKSWGGMGRC